jgi:decaprenyl-phosphate phosphoribosyltransferase
MAINHYIKLIRPKHYVKNFFIFIPIFFSVNFTDSSLILKNIVAFIAFCLIASSIYIFNDSQDIEADKKHPKKKFRPLAAGDVTKKSALSIMFLFGTSSLIISYLLAPYAALIILLYLILNISYSLKLKHIPIVDVSSIAIGFLLRVFIGGIVTGVQLSVWLILMIFLLTLFIGFAKRRDDVMIFLKSGVKAREVIGGYNLKFLDASLVTMATSTIVFYVMYTVSAEAILKFKTNNLFITSFFVIFGVLKYLQIVFVEETGGSPTEILYKNRTIQITILSWIGTFLFFIFRT